MHFYIQVHIQTSLTKDLKYFKIEDMRLSNALSASRIVLAPLFFIIFHLSKWVSISERLVIIVLIPIFIFLQITDYLDGKIARSTNTVTDFGKHFDPFCDALANLTILFCFAVEGFFPILLYIVILYREFGITFLRMLASQHNFSIPAKMGGKVKTVMYISSAGFSLLIKLLESFGLVSLQVSTLMRTFNLLLYCIAIVLSVLTFLDYLSEYKNRIKKN